MAECICGWIDRAGVLREIDPACPVHGEKWTQEELDEIRAKAERQSKAFGWDKFTPREPGAYHDGRKDKVPAPGEGDALPNPEMEIEC